MYSFDPVNLPSSQIDLSRRAARRYATLAAVREWRARQRPASRRPPTGGPRC